MTQLAVLNLDRSEAGTMELSDLIGEASFNPFLIKDAVVYQQAKLRQGTHATKSRSQVAGSTQKLYRQKGTGRARAGDRKAPQRRGGGIVHGPVPRSHATALNKKVRKSALRSALAEMIRRNKLLVVEDFALETHKTKALATILDKLEAPEALIVVHDFDENLELASRNLPTVAVIHFGQLNVFNLLLFDKVLVTRQALETLQARLVS